MSVTSNLASLRALMAERGLDAWVVPSADAHQSEYVSRNWLRRGFITGFDGSAGTAAILAEKAGLWTDGRYFLQAGQQLEGSGIDLFKTGLPGVPTLEAWLAETLSAGQRVGVNAAVFSVNGHADLEKALSPKGIELVPVPEDLVDLVWGVAQPPMPEAIVRVHPEAFAGESVDQKLARIEGVLAREGADALLICALDEIAWVFNLRGADIDYNPVFIAWALVEKGKATLFTGLTRLGPEVRDALPVSVALRPYEDIDAACAALGAAGAKVWLDPAVGSKRLAVLLAEQGATLHLATGPIPAWKAVKNAAELAGIRAAHVRDGVAMVRFLRWLEGAVPEGGVTELSAEEVLAGFRAQGERYVGPSFRTIAGYAGHGAIVHYAASPATCAELLPEGLFLIDSGGQYLDGTTDITRTVALGEPTGEQRRAYTAVLRGHLRLRGARFAAGTNGYQLDVLARSPLWDFYLDYNHGTGHGVGASLCVHEGPFSVSLRKNLTPLQIGNVLSNEPGYYKAGEFGIRVENLVQVVKAAENEHGIFLGFDDLTLCPYDRRLLDSSLLSDGERVQVNAYHARVLRVLGPLLEPAERAWLEAACAPLDLLCCTI
ncbi:MAG: aminopeptidase P family protein [Pseudomonadota bacterium]